MASDMIATQLKILLLEHVISSLKLLEIKVKTLLRVVVLETDTFGKPGGHTNTHEEIACATRNLGAQEGD